jgi:hypothetical protein
MSEWQPSTWNPNLKPWRGAQPANRGGAGVIERYDELHNIEWQTRAAPPSEYESMLADALEHILGQGIHDIAGIVRNLSEMRVMDQGGSLFTETSFEREMMRLGA